LFRSPKVYKAAGIMVHHGMLHY